MCTRAPLNGLNLKWDPLCLQHMHVCISSFRDRTHIKLNKYIKLVLFIHLNSWSHLKFFTVMPAWWMWLKLVAMYSAAARSFSISPVAFCLHHKFYYFRKKEIAPGDNISFVQYVDYFPEAFITHRVYWTHVFEQMVLLCWFQCVFVSWSTCCNRLTFMDIFC